MGGWDSGPGMIQEPELEEGEACYYKGKNDASICPDISLSYIEDKVRSILGHLLKDFEGGLSAQNLGPIFEYGSFLPVYQRFPSVRFQPKPPQRVHNPTVPGSHNPLFSEGPAPNSVKVPDAPTQRNAPLSSDQVSETLPGKIVLPTKADNSINHRTLKVRIKVKPDTMTRYDAELDSLGLASPLSSAENSPKESGGLPLESNTTLSDSPTYILQVMTSFPVPGGSLLSPLSEDLLNIVKKTDTLVGAKHEAAPTSPTISDRLLKTNFIGSTRTKSVDISKKVVKSENQCNLDLNECKEKSSGNQSLESKNKVQLRKMKVSKDRVNGKAVSSDLVKQNSLEHISDQSSSKHMQQEAKCNPVQIHRGGISHKDSAADHGQGGGHDANKNHASLNAYSDISEGRRIKGALDKPSAKVLQPAAGSEVLQTLNKIPSEKKPKASQSSGIFASKLAADSLRHDDNAAPKNKYSAKKNVQSLKLVPERPSGGRPMSLELKKAKIAYSDELKENSSYKSSDNLISQKYTAEPPAADITLDIGTNTGLEQTVAPDDWVECERCGTWRLWPPCGMKLPAEGDKWLCSMQKWLPPGMNRCDISEDETTKLIKASSYSIPVPENQVNVQAHADKRMSGASSGFAQSVDLNQQNLAYIQTPNVVKKHKLKEMQKPVSMSDPLSSTNGENNMKQRVLKESLKEENQFLTEDIATNKSSLHHSNKLQILSAKSNKRKDGPVIQDVANPKRKIKKESFQNAEEMLTKNKSKAELILEKDVGHSLPSGLPNKKILKEGMKKNLQKDSSSRGMGTIQILLKKPKDEMQDSPGNGRGVSTKKRKLKDREDSHQQAGTLQNKGSDLQERKEETKDYDIQRDKKSRGSEVEERKFKKFKVDNVSKIKCAEAKVRLPGRKENPNNCSIEKELQVTKLRAKPQLTLEDIDKVRKDLGCEQLSTAANSSSSKVSNSCKIKFRYKEVRSSPQESVSSSPARITNPDKISPFMLDTCGKVNSSTDNFSAIGSAKKCLDLKPNVVGSSIEKISGQKEPWNGKVRLDLRQRDKNGVPCPSKNIIALGSKKKSCVDSRQSDVIDDTSKAINDKSITCQQNGSDTSIRHNESEQSVALDTSLANKKNSNIIASTAFKQADDVLKEAEELKVHADLIKNSGFSSESNYEYFKAALKFLQGAALLEACNGDSSIEMNAVQVYSTAAKIWKACASDYEKNHQLAAAAIAYKCVEVVYLRVVNCKSSAMYRVSHDLESALQMVTQDESPSSSASDVDNFNNLAMADKNNLSKGIVSHFGNQVILPRNRPNFLQLLDFTKDMNSAMEATKKYKDTFAAACVKLEESRNKEGIVSVKSVIDFSFQDVEELIQLIWVALNAISVM